MAMKNLLSLLFEQILALEYRAAVHYSGACLAFYAVARSLSPLVSAGRGVFVLFAGVLAAETLAYGLTPYAISHTGSRRTLVYTAFRLLGGGSFAILLANRAVLAVRIFGVDNIAKVSGLQFATEWLAGLGPLLAFSVHQAEVAAGGDRETSFNGAFYLCAAVVAAAVVAVLALRCAAEKGAEVEKA